MRSRTVAAVGVLALVLALAGCGSSVAFPDRAPDATGVITGLVHTGEDSMTFTLSGLADGDYFYNAQITVTPDTVVGDDANRPWAWDALSSALVIDLWVDACAESYPVQCGAVAVRVEPVA